MGSREPPGQLVYDVDTAIGRISPAARSFIESSDESHDKQHEPMDNEGVLDDDGAKSSDDEADASAASASIEYVQTTMDSESDPSLIPRRAPPPPSVTTKSLSTIYLGGGEPISAPSKRKLFGLKTDGTRTGNRCPRIFKSPSTYSLIRHGRIQLV
jgi:hypothetical protein